MKNEYTEEEVFNINTSVDYIEKEFLKLDINYKKVKILSFSKSRLMPKNIISQELFNTFKRI